MSNQRYTVPCSVVSNSLAESKNGNPSVKIVLQSVDDRPRTLYADLWLTEKAFDSSVKTLREAFAWTGTDFLDLNEPILMGAEIDAVCEMEEYMPDGAGAPVSREKVLFINAPGQSGIPKLDPAKAASFVGLLNAKLSRVAPPAQGARPTGRPVPGRTPAKTNGNASHFSRPPVDDGYGYEPPRGRQISNDPEDYRV